MCLLAACVWFGVAKQGSVFLHNLCHVSAGVECVGVEIEQVFDVSEIHSECCVVVEINRALLLLL